MKTVTFWSIAQEPLGLISSAVIGPTHFEGCTYEDEDEELSNPECLMLFWVPWTSCFKLHVIFHKGIILTQSTKHAYFGLGVQHPVFAIFFFLIYLPLSSGYGCWPSEGITKFGRKVEKDYCNNFSNIFCDE